MENIDQCDCNFCFLALVCTLCSALLESFEEKEQQPQPQPKPNPQYDEEDFVWLTPCKQQKKTTLKTTTTTETIEMNKTD